jgi:hypothetical protein
MEGINNNAPNAANFQPSMGWMRMPHMQSRWLVFEILLISFIFLEQGIDTSHAQTSPGPQAFLPVTHFEFPPIFEGQEVRHEFVIQNKGTAPLDITDVQTG